VSAVTYGDVRKIVQRHCGPLKAAWPMVDIVDGEIRLFVGKGCVFCADGTKMERSPYWALVDDLANSLEGLAHVVPPTAQDGTIYVRPWRWT